jgi:hypothetical protein
MLSIYAMIQFASCQIFIARSKFKQQVEETMTSVSYIKGLFIAMLDNIGQYEFIQTNVIPLHRRIQQDSFFK